MTTVMEAGPAAAVSGTRGWRSRLGRDRDGRPLSQAQIPGRECCSDPKCPDGGEREAHRPEAQ